jgi:TonB family protein
VASIVVHALVITTIELAQINGLVLPQIPPSEWARRPYIGRFAPIVRIVTPHRSFRGTLSDAFAPIQTGRTCGCVIGDETTPRQIVDGAPRYPKGALDAHLEGTVILEVPIAIDGSVAYARVLSGPPMFQRPSFEAVQQWRFDLVGIDNALPMLMRVAFVFRLPE